MAKPKIRHLAMISRDPEKLAKFYAQVFDMEIIRHVPATPSQPGPAYFVSDGYLTLAILPFIIEGSTPTCGLNHFGFAVEDCEEIAARLAAFGIDKPKKRPADRPYAEVRAADPEGNMFDLSQRGFEKTAATRAGKLPA